MKTLKSKPVLALTLVAMLALVLAACFPVAAEPCDNQPLSPHGTTCPGATKACSFPGWYDQPTTVSLSALGNGETYTFAYKGEMGDVRVRTNYGDVDGDGNSDWGNLQWLQNVGKLVFGYDYENEVRTATLTFAALLDSNGQLMVSPGTNVEVSCRAPDGSIASRLMVKFTK